ncbi:hypothetical protein GALMADRAFT_274805 [Galerina marginata CBS 339.88]|uniref:Uncharacterized protein n=1 Tax=Galerina marginata (strain CBS 339.88) TaxID=685588 RepID=A0A067U3V7_GALM3|nr:hypothetical protein GALMADRAFT_274805 [Galerina marginata CBS 339.88]
MPTVNVLDEKEFAHRACAHVPISILAPKQSPIYGPEVEADPADPPSAPPPSQQQQHEPDFAYVTTPTKRNGMEGPHRPPARRRPLHPADAARRRLPIQKKLDFPAGARVDGRHLLRLRLRNQELAWRLPSELQSMRNMILQRRTAKGSP